MWNQNTHVIRPNNTSVNVENISSQLHIENPVSFHCIVFPLMVWILAST